MHMLGDSYAMGHVVRGFATKYGTAGTAPAGSTVPAGLAGAVSDPLETITQRCGDVLNFQGYGTQHNNDEHGNKDHDPTDVIKGRGRPDIPVRKQLARCSVSANYRLLKAAYACIKASGSGPACAPTALNTLLDAVYHLALPNELAGGSDVSMADPKYSKTAFTTIPYTMVDPTGATVSSTLVAPLMPTPLPANARRWANMPAHTGLCGAIRARGGPLSMTTAPFTDFFNPDSTGADQNKH